jgi:hypothetical protein
MLFAGVHFDWWTYSAAHKVHMHLGKSTTQN